MQFIRNSKDHIKISCLSQQPNARVTRANPSHSSELSQE